MHLFQREKKLLEGFHTMVKSYYHPNKGTLLTNTSNTIITKEIKDYFRKAGVDAGFHVAPDDSSPEWLFDMKWYCHIKGTLTDVMMTEVELILESELDYHMNAIRYDFEKLLIASPKIPFKIFICLLGKKDLGEVKSYFDDAVQSCRTVVNGDSFICLIGDDYGSGEFIVHKVVKH
jgi:hypothetical protein